MSNIQFFHQKDGLVLFFKQRFTVAYTPLNLTKEALGVLVANPTVPIVVNIGISFCHSKDQFIKKIGRDMATLNMKMVEFKLTNIDMHDDKRYNVAIHSLDGQFGIRFRFYKDSDKTRIVQIINYNNGRNK